MSKATYKRQHLVEGLLTVSEGESRIIMVRGMAAGGRHGTGAVAESLHPHPQAGRKTELMISE